MSAQEQRIGELRKLQAEIAADLSAIDRLADFVRKTHLQGEDGGSRTSVTVWP